MFSQAKRHVPLEKRKRPASLDHDSPMLVDILAEE
jgi:hypothetical protein